MITGICKLTPDYRVLAASLIFIYNIIVLVSNLIWRGAWFGDISLLLLCMSVNFPDQSLVGSLD